MTTDDKEDWQRFCHNENGEKAFERIYEQHKNRMFTYCLYVTGDSALSEDIVQETFLRLAQQREKLTIRESLADWLFICARNIALNHVAHRNRVEKPTPFLEENSPALDAEARLFLSQILGRLSVEDRELLLMKEWQGRSVRDISQILSISEENVRVRLYRARKQMQELARRK
jgi:RNA polymerase sigma-70 factor (ECF subfamily)